MTEIEYKYFEIRLKALSPISITRRTFNILSETYWFIPAWTMWNAFVKLFALFEGNRDYKDAKSKLKSIRLTNFYIIENNEALFSFDETNRKKYISSDLKNAINPLSNTSLEGALYEREYIHAKNFIGWVKINSSDSDLNTFFSELKGKLFFIGADKNTGFGKVKVEKISEIQVEKPSSDKTKPKNFLFKPKNNNYLLPVESDEKEFFPLTLREWDKEKGSGMKIVLIEGSQND
ncbi:hypothetical protein [Desulfurobacterium atlanticum]|uniref:Uncharacterized protein n=1 Tax=Desulfurobacterium atlanticum TaxID=240169 RepID=A0A239A3V4_9BACT|nr:hypothetical protein [Desulfurobacterium atlanticum]SNR89583.1 hypothetical protein SAMN06265340_11433 [Desulfurobacterium atlanticum]